MKRLLTPIFILMSVMFLMTAIALAESPKAEMTRVFGTELGVTYADKSTRPAATAACESVGAKLNVLIENKTMLDFDLNERQVDIFNKIDEVLTHQQMKHSATRNVYGDIISYDEPRLRSVLKIFYEVCEDKVGWHHDLQWVDKEQYEKAKAEHADSVQEHLQRQVRESQE